jgi:hypothetical protein
MLLGAALVVASVALPAGAPAASAPTWQIDPTFGVGGRAQLDVGKDGNLYSGTFVSTATRAYWNLGTDNRNGRDRFVAALSPDGTLVPGFAPGGGSIQRTPGVFPYTGLSDAMGRLYDFAQGENIGRYGPDLALDPSYSVPAGTVGTCNSGEFVTDFAVDPAGRLTLAKAFVQPIPAGSCAARNQHYSNLVVERYDPTGALDPSWGTAGRTAIPSTPGGTGISAMAFSADGTLVAASAPQLFALDPAGRLAASFGTGGTAQAPTGEQISRVVPLPDGAIDVMTFGARDEAVFQIGADGAVTHGPVDIPKRDTLGMLLPAPTVLPDSSIAFATAMRGAFVPTRAGAAVRIVGPRLEMYAGEVTTLNEAGNRPDRGHGSRTVPNLGGDGALILPNGQLIVSSVQPRGQVEWARLSLRSTPFAPARAPRDSPAPRLRVTGIQVGGLFHAYGSYGCAAPSRCPMATVSWRIRRRSSRGTATSAWTTPATAFPGELAFPVRSSLASELPVKQLLRGAYTLEAALTDVYGRHRRASLRFSIKTTARLPHL